MTALTTFRAGRTDGDTTTWTYDDPTGLETAKTYADGKGTVKTYDAYNRLATETDARGRVKTYSYEQARGLLLGISYSDNTTSESFAYNHLGQLTQVTDDAGVRSIGYNAYGERETDSLLAEGVTHLITETRDSFGRSTGYTYAKNGVTEQTVTTAYGTDGRISGAGFIHGGQEKQFSYGYLQGSHLLQTLTKPNGMTLTQTYEQHRDLLTQMDYKRGDTLVAQRTYAYDQLGRPTTRTITRQGSTRTDAYTYNNRSELIGDVVDGTGLNGWDYDNIGNRRMEHRSDGYEIYTANNLNQYTAIEEAEGTFTPTYDADGNQTQVKTSTGIWNVTYNAKNRPVLFTKDDNSVSVECTYDYMGRRATKKVTENGTVTLHQRYLYRGYLQIAACDLLRPAHPCIWLITWDPTQPIATRPLAIQKDGTWYTYGWDLTKNVWEVYGTTGYIRTDYTYSPYGEVTVSGDVEQPIQWSSEQRDEELNLIYYIHRFYNCTNGIWSNRDVLTETESLNLYLFARNNPICYYDYLGNSAKQERRDGSGQPIKDMLDNAIPNNDKKSGCLFSVFYRHPQVRNQKGDPDYSNNDNKSVTQWSDCEDNNYISHVAIYTDKFGKQGAIGFSPKTETIDSVRRIHFEPQRDEVVLIMRCCNGNIDKVNDFLNYNVNIRKGTHYFPQKEDGTYGHGRWWWMNGENCSVFAWNAYAIYYNDFTEPDWDNVWGIGGEAPDQKNIDNSWQQVENVR